MDERCIGELIAIAKEIDGVADELSLEGFDSAPRAVQLFRLALRLRRVIAAMPS